MKELSEFCELDNKNVLDVNAEYIKRRGMWSTIKAELIGMKSSIQHDMDKMHSRVLHELMYQSDIQYSLQEAKQFALNDKGYATLVELQNGINGCILICDEAIDLLKGIGWALKLQAEMLIEGLNDVTF